MTRLSGLADLIAFLDFLDDKGIWYRLDRVARESVMVSATLVGIRVEIEVFEGRVEYSVFRGDEAVLDDQESLFGMIEDCVREDP